MPKVNCKWFADITSYKKRANIYGSINTILCTKKRITVAYLMRLDQNHCLRLIKSTKIRIRILRQKSTPYCGCYIILDVDEISK